MARKKETLMVLTDAMALMPVSKVRWVHRDKLRANDYNPNHVAPLELALLKLSIVEDGWTQPIVIRQDGEIVDGFHRWTLSADPEVGGVTGYHVPVVTLEGMDPDDQRLSTIRHNRARGTHGVLKMADIVRSLVDEFNMSPDEVEKKLGMEAEEVDRLYDASGMPTRGAKKDGYSSGWEPDDGDKT